VVVLRLLGHRERARHGDLDPPVGERAQKLDVANLDRLRAAHRADHSRHRALVAGAVEGHARVVEVDPLERRGEAVRVALPPHLPVGDHVHPGELHVAHREAGRVVLRFLQIRLGDTPELAGAHPRGQPVAQPPPVDQPLRLGVAADNGRDESHACESMSALPWLLQAQLRALAY
jgi:hypothetical protein